jgi:signal transduction histidine kinase
MAEQIRLSLRQRERLAALGAAVARIGHDLRNMLSTAQLVTDRLSSSADPIVRQIAPRLERSIGRAAGLAASTLKFGRVDEAAPQLKRVDLNDAIAAASEDVLTSYDGFEIAAEGAENAFCSADPDQLHRILVNLIRNGARAMNGENRDGRGLTVRVLRSGKLIAIMVEDRGPGVLEIVRPRLVEPFVSGDRQAGSGLGLAIARELARAMGGDVALLRSDRSGAVFQITLPAG